MVARAAVRSRDDNAVEMRLAKLSNTTARARRWSALSRCGRRGSNGRGSGRARRCVGGDDLLVELLLGGVPAPGSGELGEGAASHDRDGVVEGPGGLLLEGRRLHALLQLQRQPQLYEVAVGQVHRD